MNFNLEQALQGISNRYTPEERAKDEAARVNRIGALKLGLDPNSYEQRIARARQQIEGIVEQIVMLAAAPDSELKTSRLLTAQKRLAELLAESGDLEMAGHVSPDSKQTAWFDALLDAIEKDNAESCDCTDARIFDASKNQELTAPVRTVIATIPSLKHGRLMTVERCSNCGFLNAR
jgi:hypothetical protein